VGLLSRGGVPLMASMAQLGWRPSDAPAAWWDQLRRGFTGR
jgi:hypothetical protein